MKQVNFTGFVAAAVLFCGVACATPALADDGFDPSAVILANAAVGPSFAPLASEKEAQLWVLNAGYNQVSGLTRDDRAIYHGTALLNGETYDIVVDNEGNILGTKIQ